MAVIVIPWWWAMNARTMATRSPSGTRAWREVQRLVETVPAASANGLKALEVPRGGLGVDHARQGGGVGSDHRVVRQPSLQAEAGDAEVGVLVGELQVAGVVGGLRYAPRRLQRRRVFDLAADDQPVGLLDQAARPALS